MPDIAIKRKHPCMFLSHASILHFSIHLWDRAFPLFV
jgi:hypothetical protein